MTVKEYINYFSSKEQVYFEQNPMMYKIVKEINEPIAFFDHENVFFKVEQNDKFYLLKCCANKQNHDYTPKNLEDVSQEKSEKNKADERYLVLELEDGTFNKKIVGLELWNDDFVMASNKTRYIKQLHNTTDNSIYRKRRTKIKIAIILLLGVVFSGIIAAKHYYSHEILVNPIDYRQLIVDDSTRQVNLAISDNKQQLASKSLTIQKKIIALPTITEIINDKSGSEKLIKEQKIKKEKEIEIKKNKQTTAPKLIIKKIVEPKDSIAMRKKREKTEQAVKEMNAKKTVDFKSTDF